MHGGAGVPYFGLPVPVLVQDGVCADEDEDADPHGEGPEHLHPLRVAVLVQEARQEPPCRPGRLTYREERSGGSTVSLGLTQGGGPSSFPSLSRGQ